MRIVFLCVATAAIVSPQSNRNTELVVRVEPQAELNLSTAPLRFVVAAGAAAAPAITLLARARPGPNQRIRLTVTPGGDLQGPNGAIPISEVRWSGARTEARGGGATATCTSGALARSAPQDLAANWNRGGTLACTVTFSLEGASRFPPGVYTGTAYFDVRFE